MTDSNFFPTTSSTINVLSLSPTHLEQWLLQKQKQEEEESVPTKTSLPKKKKEICFLCCDTLNFADFLNNFFFSATFYFELNSLS